MNYQVKTRDLKALTHTSYIETSVYYRKKHTHPLKRGHFHNKTECNCISFKRLNSKALGSHFSGAYAGFSEGGCREGGGGGAEIRHRP